MGNTIMLSMGALHRPPIAVWRQQEGELVLHLPKDRMQFWISFLPEAERTLRPTGIHLFNIRYWSPALPDPIPFFGPPEGGVFRLFHDGGLTAPSGL
ncbi:Mu transposase C-terminal domain-containing protein, partial [Mesorhizobium sp. M0676]|uniref:Mu transposase C-terminal domain-containing protein n=1 Tax=Mesorhizobium sp. M0676 TaxID=2956984 RepID=UPI00333C8A58